MAITVSVDAAWRVGRVEIDTPYHEPGTVRGRGEVLVSESNKETSDTFGTGKPYGAIMGENITRNIEDVMDAEVEISGGTKISWRTVMEAMPLFFEAWRREDIESPPPSNIDPGPGEEMPGGIFVATEQPPMREELPPPKV